MNKTLKAFMIIFCCIIWGGCSNKQTNTDLWDSAVYKTDTELGTGEKTITIDVTVLENSVEFIINTDKNTLGEALTEHNLISGENDIYGMYVKNVNGITADYDTDKSYWAFYKDGEYLPGGVDTTEISDGEHFEIVYTK